MGYAGLYRNRNIGTICFTGDSDGHASEKKNCILLSTTKNFGEMRELASAIEYSIVGEIVQVRSKPDNRYFLGKGKIREIECLICQINEGKSPNDTNFDEFESNESEEDVDGAVSEDANEESASCAMRIKERLGDGKIDVAIVCADLKPSQVFNLRKILNIEIFDRTRLILEIFTERAHSEEAKLQVELARLQYEIPIVKETIHRTKHGEHPGLFYAGGEYGVDVYLNMIKSRVRGIKEELAKIENERTVKRKHRRKTGFYLASIVGYTNAGKSSLLNLLAEDDAIVEDRLFSTLSTTTRRSKHKALSLPVLLTDTVGFIEDLPHWLIEAFHSTLEEVFLSDVAILVVDISDPITDILRKMRTSHEVISSGDSKPKLIVAFNKKDLLSEGELNFKLKAIKECAPFPIDPYVIISAKSEEGIKELAKVMSRRLSDLMRAVAEMPNIDDKAREKEILSWLKEHSTFRSFENKVFDDGRCGVRIELELRERYASHASELLSSIGGKIELME